jgi:hypothetical protein
MTFEVTELTVRATAVGLTRHSSILRLGPASAVGYPLLSEVTEW